MKIFLDQNVHDASVERIKWMFDTFSKVCVSFSGGKDSTVALHLTAECARIYGRKFSVLFIDWEVQYTLTIDFVDNMRRMYHDVIETFYWVALPLTTVNGLSQHAPEWISWEKDTPWVRQPPGHAITSPDFFPFYHYGMTFEEFVPAFNRWFSDDIPSAIIVGIRADESLNRRRALFRQKSRFEPDKSWTTRSADNNSCLIYPVYDWKVKDIWIYFARTKKPVNEIYELMYKAGVPLSNMRICEPYGLEQRRGLWLYHVMEPELWNKACQRVHGAISGAIYSQGNSGYFGNKSLSKPDELTWQEYAMKLLESMPVSTAEHYRNKFSVYLRWYMQRDFPEGIPDEQPGDIGAKDIPSWRRLCKCILKNDYWCRMLSFSPTKNSAYAKYRNRLQQYRKEWGLL